MRRAALASRGSLSFREPYHTSSDIQSPWVGSRNVSPPGPEYRECRGRSQPAIAMPIRPSALSRIAVIASIIAALISTRSGNGSNPAWGRKPCIHLNRNNPLMATGSGFGSSSIVLRKMAIDIRRASDQREAQTWPVEALSGRRQRSWHDQNPVGAMPMAQAGKRDARSLRRRVTKGLVRPVWSS